MLTLFIVILVIAAIVLSVVYGICLMAIDLYNLYIGRKK